MSLSDSPFSTEEPLALTEMTSAERRFAASSKDELVRVLGSRKRLTMVLPRRAGTFLMSRRPIPSAKLSARLHQVLDVGALEVGDREQVPHPSTSASASLTADRDLVHAVLLLDPHVTPARRATVGRFLPM